MITSLHSMIYSDHPAETRAFFRDVLQLPFVEDSSGEPGWLIFKTGPSEMGVHPTSGEWEGETYSFPRHHSISLMCVDIHQTVAELRSRGAEFSGEIQDHGYGLVAMLIVPSAGEIQLYEPRHRTAYDLES